MDRDEIVETRGVGEMAYARLISVVLEREVVRMIIPGENEEPMEQAMKMWVVVTARDGGLEGGGF